ncbi:MAG: DNA-processing protein DprA [Acidimicrobiales bacterium]
MAERGALVSEVPLGGGPTTWRFPARNRIIAALAEAVVIVESRATGGSMLTAAEAVARDRPVLAVPGHPTAPAAAGPLDLIADGAIPLRDVDDILVAIGRGGAAAGSARRARPGPAQVSEGGRAVLGALERGPSTFGELAGRVALPIEAVTLALAELEEAGLAAHRGMWIELTTSGSSQAVGP